MTTLYLAEQGAVLKKSGDTFQVTKEDKEVASIPARQVDQVAANVAAGAWKLTAEETTEVDAITE